MTTPALLVIDMQQAIDDPALGRRGQPGMEDAIASLLAAWRARRLPVIHIRHDSLDPSSPYRPGTPGNEFKPEAAPIPGEPIVDKRTASAFIGTDLMDALDELQVRRLVIAGAFLENSVEATIRMARDLGFEVVIPEDAVASIDRTDSNGRHWTAEDVHALVLVILEGNYARVTSSASVIETLP